MVKLAEQYAEVAQNLLEEQGEPYTEDDIVKVANFLIDEDYPAETPENETEKLAEEAFLAGFIEEMQKVAAWKTPNGYAEALGYRILEALLPAASKLKPDGVRSAIYNKALMHPKTVGYGAAALGTGTIGAAGYGGYRLMRKD